MQQEIKVAHWDDKNGNPAGGCTNATGLCISWQHGPLGRGEERKEPNGCFVETVIAAAIDRLEYYQHSAFACDANLQALGSLEVALLRLRERTDDRVTRAVEGTHAV